ncbi:Protein fem-1 B [Porites harrisoni]
MAHFKLLPSPKFSRKYPDDPKTEVVEAAKSGDAELLNEVLEELNSAERILAVRDYPFGRELKTTPLINAVENGNLDCVKVLLKYKADTEGRGDFHLSDLFPYPYFWLCGTPLCVAAAYGNLEILNCLVENGADINAATNYVPGLTPLMFAVQESHIDAVNYLLDQGADVNLQQESGYTALHFAAANGYFNALKCLIKHGADVNARDKNNRTPLMLACESVNKKAIDSIYEKYRDQAAKCYFKALKRLMKNGADVNAHDENNDTPLMLACEGVNKKAIEDSVYKNSGHDVTSSAYNYFDAVSLLIDEGADVNLQDNSGYSALHFAAGSTHKYGVAINVYGFYVNIITGDKCPSRMVPSQHNNMKVVNCLLQNGANVDLQDEDGQTALFHALRNKGIPFGILSSLVKNGANLNTRRKYDKCTPLMSVTQSCGIYEEQLVTWLVENGADVDLQDKDGLTALHYACKTDNSCEVVSCLIKNGANINACTGNKVTPLMRAAKKGNSDVVSLLIAHGANVDLQDKDGDTAFHYTACEEDSLDKMPMEKTILKLLTAGASCLCKNSHGLTPLLATSNSSNRTSVLFLIKRPEFTKEQRIDALELLGASLSLDHCYWGGFRYIKHGMEERFTDPFNPILKQQMKPIEAYQNRKESQTLEELALVEGDQKAMIMESLVVKERILGRNNEKLLKSIRCAANYFGSHQFSLCIGLYRHAMKIAQCCNQSASRDLNGITKVLESRLENSLPKEDPVFELLDQTVLDHDYELQRTKEQDYYLFCSLFRILRMIGQKELGEKDKFSNAAVLLKTICNLNPRDYEGNTLLNEFIGYYGHSGSSQLCTAAVKLLVNAGFNVNAVNNNGDTALHFIAGTLGPWEDEHIQFITEILQLLFNGGAHHDFVNNDGKTPMDMAESDEVRMILSERRKLELKCISARAVKKFGIPFLGVVPKILEKYISMH